MALMLDHPKKTAQLLGALKAAAPFEVELTSSLVEHLRAENVIEADQKRHVVSDLSYAGDEGGIVCHLSCSQEDGRAFVVSLTHVRVARSMPLAAAVLDYQRHRMKKIKKQSWR
jgi:hypothetical protein